MTRIRLSKNNQEYESISEACRKLGCNRKFFEKNIIYERLYPEGYWNEMMSVEQLKVIGVRKAMKKRREQEPCLIRLNYAR